MEFEFWVCQRTISISTLGFLPKGESVLCARWATLLRDTRLSSLADQDFRIKIDIRLVPVLTILYLIAHIDRANIGNAKIEGLIEDLGLTGTQYNLALAIFFPPYILCMMPSNIVLRRFRQPSRYIGTLITLWGIVMTCTGLVHNFAELVAVRFLLGMLE